MTSMLLEKCLRPRFVGTPERVWRFLHQRLVQLTFDLKRLFCGYVEVGVQFLSKLLVWLQLVSLLNLLLLFFHELLLHVEQ